MTSGKPSTDSPYLNDFTMRFCHEEILLELEFQPNTWCNVRCSTYAVAWWSLLLGNTSLVRWPGVYEMTFYNITTAAEDISTVVISPSYTNIMCEVLDIVVVHSCNIANVLP